MEGTIVTPFSAKMDGGVVVLSGMGMWLPKALLLPSAFFLYVYFLAARLSANIAVGILVGILVADVLAAGDVASTVVAVALRYVGAAVLNHRRVVPVSADLTMYVAVHRAEANNSGVGQFLKKSL
jgi:hypothetical protein